MSFKKIYKTGLTALVMLSAFAFAPASSAVISYSQNFESLDINSPTALSDDGWLVGANVYNSSNVYQYGYFSFPAPNGGSAFSGIVTGEGGVPQGDQQLTIYNDYNNANHGDGSNFIIEALVFQEMTVGADDVGTTVDFSFDAKLGNLLPPSTANVFVKVLKSSDNSFALLGQDVIDTTNLSGNWDSFLASLFIDGNMEGELLQFGFSTRASNFDPSGNFYDNINVSNAVVPLPGAVWLFGSGLLGLVGFARRRS